MAGDCDAGTGSGDAGMRHLGLAAVALCVVGVCVGTALSNGQNDGGEGIQITVAPNAIVLSSPMDSVTVHSNVLLSLVDAVAINGVTDIAVWADDRGHLVARVALAALEGVEPPELTITLSGVLTSGEVFEASDTVRVVRGKK